MSARDYFGQGFEPEIGEAIPLRPETHAPWLPEQQRVPSIRQKFEANQTIFADRVFITTEELLESCNVLKLRPKRVVKCHVIKFSEDARDADTVVIPPWV